MERAIERMKIVVPVTLLTIFLLLYLSFWRPTETFIGMLSVPFALVGGVWLMWWLDYNLSVAVAVGFIAMAGVAAETGVVMLIYLDHAWEEAKGDGGMMGGAFSTNGRRFDIDRIDLAEPAGSVEVWQFINATGMAHPMHVHGVRMSLLARDGNVPAASEQGLRDTFVVEAMQTVSVAVETPLVASPVPLMFHCHILEQEDDGMMGQFITV